MLLKYGGWGAVSEKIKTEFKNTLRQMTRKTQLYKTLWDAAKLVLEESS